MLLNASQPDTDQMDHFQQRNFKCDTSKDEYAARTLYIYDMENEISNLETSLVLLLDEGGSETEISETIEKLAELRASLLVYSQNSANKCC